MIAACGESPDKHVFVVTSTAPSRSMLTFDTTAVDRCIIAVMQKCKLCGSDTKLWIGDMPICLDCDAKIPGATPAVPTEHNVVPEHVDSSRQ